MGCASGQPREKKAVSPNKKCLAVHVVNSDTMNNFDTRCRYSDRDLLDDYDMVEEVLGEGVNGTVIKARNKLTGDVHALKTLSKQGLDNEKLRGLTEEANNYLRIDHPNIARLLHVYEETSRLHLVMEVCPGKELFLEIAARKKFPELEASHVTRQLFLAVAYLHRYNIVHCDIKLENILYEQATGHVRLIDFGLSKTWDPQKNLSLDKGTLSYTAPEVFEGRSTNKCDIWSLGVVIFIVLSGVPPFPMNDNTECRRRIEAGEYTMQNGHWEDISATAKAFVERILVVSPDDRLSALQALQEPWLQITETSLPAGPQALMDGLRRYEGASHMTRAAFAMIAHHLSSAELEGVRAAFMKFDTDMTGTITRQNFTDAFGGAVDLQDGELGRLFDTIDTAGDGEIHYSEFAAALLGTWIDLRTDCVREAFKLFDVSRTGCITKSDMQQILGGSQSKFKGSAIDALITECCGDAADGITFDEFLEHLVSGRKVQGMRRSTNSTLGSILFTAMKRRSMPDLGEIFHGRSPSKDSRSSRGSSRETWDNKDVITLPAAPSSVGSTRNQSVGDTVGTVVSL